jgi:hypothetical protein
VKIKAALVRHLRDQGAIESAVTEAPAFAMQVAAQVEERRGNRCRAPHPR